LPHRDTRTKAPHHKWHMCDGGHASNVGRKHQGIYAKSAKDRVSETEKRSPLSVGETNKFREEMGMCKIVSGKRECLRCEKMFVSNDVKSNRLCDLCVNNAKSYA